MYGGDPPINPIPYESLHFLLAINKNRKRLTIGCVLFVFIQVVPIPAEFPCSFLSQYMSQMSACSHQLILLLR